MLLIVLQILARAFGALAAPGRITDIFVAGYAAARIFVEFFREPDVQIGYLFGGWLTMGHLLTLPMLIAGLALLSLAYRRNETSGNERTVERR